MSDAFSEDLHALVKPEQLAHMRQGWRLQQIGWALIAILVLAGAAGVFGRGPLSWTTRSAGAAAVEYERFIRRDAPFTLRFSVPIPAGSTRAELNLARRYLDRVRILSIFPTPVRTTSGAETTTFAFGIEPAAKALTVTIHAEANEIGSLNGELAAGDARIPFHQLVWP